MIGCCVLLLVACSSHPIEPVFGLRSINWIVIGNTEIAYEDRGIVMYWDAKEISDPTEIRQFLNNLRYTAIKETTFYSTSDLIEFNRKLRGRAEVYESTGSSELFTFNSEYVNYEGEVYVLSKKTSQMLGRYLEE